MAVLFTYATGVFQITRPGQTQSPSFKVPIREHVRQTKGVVIFLCKWTKREGKKSMNVAKQQPNNTKQLSEP